MPLLDVQKRHMEIFRIRIGDRDDDNNPRKLTDSMRVTAQSKAVVEAFVEEFGGGVTGWETGHQAYLPVTELPIMLLPGQSISAWWELYTGGVCAKRCDGETNQLTGEPCSCPPDITVRMQTKGACRPMTRINFICPDVAVVGAGSLVTHSLIAAETLPQAVAVADAALSRGLMVPAVLRVVEHVGKKRRYIVPQLEIVGVSLKTLANGEVPKTSIGFAPKEVEAPRAELAPTPPALEQAEKAARPKTRRPNRQPPLPGEDEGRRPALSSETSEPAGSVTPADEAGAAPSSPPSEAPPAVSMPDNERSSFLARLNKLKNGNTKKCMDALRTSYGPPDTWLAKDGGKIHDLLLKYEQATS